MREKTKLKRFPIYAWELARKHVRKNEFIMDFIAEAIEEKVARIKRKK